MRDQSLPDLEAMGLFVAVVEHGGFTAAARATGVTKALLSRRVGKLEERLRTQLLTRTTRSVRLTDEGRQYFELAAKALASAREAEATLAAGLARPVGRLRVTTTAILADMLLEPVSVRYLEKHPQVVLELDVSSRAMDLARDGFDLAIRAGRLVDSSLTARRLGEARTGYYASPGYVRRRGAPTTPSELLDHAAVVIGDGAAAWPFLSAPGGRAAPDAGGLHAGVTPRPRLVTTSHDLAVRAALAGLGIVRVPEFHVRGHVTAGRLVAVLDPWTPPPIPVHALMPPGIQPAKTRAFLDLVVRELARSPLGRSDTR